MIGARDIEETDFSRFTGVPRRSNRNEGSAAGPDRPRPAINAVWRHVAGK